MLPRRAVRSFPQRKKAQTGNETRAENRQVELLEQAVVLYIVMFELAYGANGTLEWQLGEHILSARGKQVYGKTKPVEIKREHTEPAGGDRATHHGDIARHGKKNGDRYVGKRLVRSRSHNFLFDGW